MDRPSTAAEEGAGAAGRGFRGVHPALRRVVDRPPGALAAVDRAVVDDLRRPRDDRRLEHLGGLAGEGAAGALVARAHPPRAGPLLGLPTTRATPTGPA